MFEIFSALEHLMGRESEYAAVMGGNPGLVGPNVIGDLVEFDTIPPDGPARLRIVGRHRHFVNAFGENLIVEEIENAVTEASERAGVTVGEFSAAPVYPDEGRRAGLELVVEEPVVQALAEQGYEPEYGARPLRRVLRRRLENPLATELLAEQFSGAAGVRVQLAAAGGGELSFQALR